MRIFSEAFDDSVEIRFENLLLHFGKGGDAKLFREDYLGPTERQKTDRENTKAQKRSFFSKFKWR